MSMKIQVSSGCISATVAKNIKDVDDSIKTFLSDKKNYVISLDIELSLSRDADGVIRSKIAILTLCDGDHCLIVQLPFLDAVPTSLCNFLQLADYTFVGFDIARSMERLQKEYGFGCKNCADLRTLAAHNGHYSAFSGSSKMREELRYHRKVYKPASAVFDDWGGRQLNENQIKRAAMNVYDYHLIVRNHGHYDLGTSGRRPNAESESKAGNQYVGSDWY